MPETAKKALVQVEHLKMYFPIMKGYVIERHQGDVKAVDDVSFEIMEGETLGLVGESGCGKSTLGRAITRLYNPTAGKVVVDGVDVTNLSGKPLRDARRNMQMVFQDPYSSLNPRMTIGNIISEPFHAHDKLSKAETLKRVQNLLEMVEMSPHYVDRYPHEFSGGQRQRIVIARALALHPKFIVCDEPISALDVSIQAQIVNLLDHLQKQNNLTYLFIAHDLSMVEYISDRVAVMYLGKIMEMTDKETLFREPVHPYTQALMSAVPVPDPKIEEQRKQVYLQGDLPSPINPPVGCNFCTRCPAAKEICMREEPELTEYKPGHKVACHFAGQINL